jgi:type I restriction enzyme M protein
VNGLPQKASFIGSVANLLRSDYKASEYGKVILPFTVIRRFDGIARFVARCSPR